MCFLVGLRVESFFGGGGQWIGYHGKNSFQEEKGIRGKRGGGKDFSDYFFVSFLRFFARKNQMFGRLLSPVFLIYRSRVLSSPMYIEKLVGMIEGRVFLGATLSHVCRHFSNSHSRLVVL